MSAAEPTTIRRDPFARAELERTNIARPERNPCLWCGSAPGRFSYSWVSDGGRCLDNIAGIPNRSGFCSVGCWESYQS
jgi:hypothetical protein